MIKGAFKYEDDLVKHYVRLNGWLPNCKRRLDTIRSGATKKNARRLRYFTFCAVGAMDVLMLDVENVIRAKDGRFDTVVFFDKDPFLVAETLKSIPGADGFPGDFTKTVLMPDAYENQLVDGTEALEPLIDENDKILNRENQILLSQRRRFITLFPFDVLNLDLQDFLFKPNDPIPGRVLNSLRKLFEWQRKPFVVAGNNHSLSGFSLMFTTQIGPPNLTENYLTELRGCLGRNLNNDQALVDLLRDRTGCTDAIVLQQDDFDTFFKLSVPKIIAATLEEKDWHVDPARGITIFEFERDWKEGTYKMLHLVMDVNRNNPPEPLRVPGTRCPQAEEAYQAVVRQLFQNNPIAVNDNALDTEALKKSIEAIKARRRLYSQE